MKHILLAILVLLPALVFADIIALIDNGRIEGVKVVSITAEEVVYIQNGEQKTIASSEVEGVLYDDGRFVTPPKRAILSNPVEPSDDSWAIDNTSIPEDTLSASPNRSQKRVNREGSVFSPEVQQAFKEAGVAIKDAFTTTFSAIGKKTGTSSPENSNTAARSNQGTSSVSDDNW